MKQNIVIGISGGIAAYKIIDLVKLLLQKRKNIEVVMTKSSTNLISPKEFEKVINKKVYTELFPAHFDSQKVLKRRKVDHIDLAKKANLVIIAPATANIIGKLAHGIADCFLTTLVLATKAPILICPSMNTNMWENPIVKKNVKKLKKLNYHFISPSQGQLACGVKGIGRLSHPVDIIKEASYLLSQRIKLKDKKIIITAGGTKEPIDKVRFITNRSSGKMGIALAEACFLQGASVLLLRSATSVTSQYDIEEKTFTTGKQLQELIKKSISDYEVIFHVAAVSDFIPQKNFLGKINSKKPITLRLNPAPKICNQIKSWNSRVKLIGFKAVYKKNIEEIEKIGLKKLKECQADYIIVNDIGRKDIGFEADDNEVYVICRKGLVKKIDKAPKKEIAKQIISVVDF